MRLVRLVGVKIDKRFFSELEVVKKKLDEAKQPFFFFDDDPDGVCAFLQFYKYKKEGDWQMVRSSPSLNEQYIRKINPLNDKIFILDKPLVSKQFLEQTKNDYEIIWVDHHEPQEEKGIIYTNPRNYEINIPTALITYFIVKESLWVAAVGSIGDWFLPPFIDELSEKFPDLISKDIKTPEEALFNSGFGTIAKIISFNLKGKGNQIKKSIKSLIQIKDPHEILLGTTPAGTYLLKRFNNLNSEFEEHLKKAKESAKGKLVLYIYNSQTSFTKELANELLYNFPDKVVVVGREAEGHIRLSFRSAKHNLLELLPKVFEGLNGGAGGHEHACGGHISKSQLETMIQKLKKVIS
ncbi:MAG: hypothetical protein PWP03_461 [Candidatus Woesearchaeota archaeon]|nr:hypothetical protein [Candidatus Woesearchaeota archaeon]MDN5327823.1 hypothetical protein [Candidatus Woesearchaeota archaeon]